MKIIKIKGYMYIYIYKLVGCIVLVISCQRRKQSETLHLIETDLIHDVSGIDPSSCENLSIYIFCFMNTHTYKYICVYIIYKFVIHCFSFNVTQSFRQTAFHQLTGAVIVI